MINSKQVSAILIASLLAASAATGVAAQTSGDREERRAEMFQDLDANNDGSVSEDEFVNRPDRFARADTDSNGVLSAEELLAAGDERAERRVARMIERLDANEDGVLSQEEIEARRSPAGMFDRLDANNDGMVSEEEFADARIGHRGGGKRGHGKW